MSMVVGLMIQILMESKNMLSNKWFNISSSVNDNSQLMVRVPKRVVKLASHRNLIKRLVHESFRLTEKTVNKKVTVNLKMTFLKQDRATVRASLDEMLRKMFT